MFRVSGFMYMSDPPHGMLILDLQAGGNPTPTPTSSIDAPILANLSTGWVTGQNPTAWQSTYPNAQGYAPISGAGDQVRAHWKLGAGSWNVTAWEPLDDELTDGVAPPWAFLTDGSLNAGGVFQVYEEVVRDLGLPTQQFSTVSNTWTDTLSAVISAPTVVHLRTEEIDGLYGTGPFAAGSALACLSGDKIEITIFGHYSGSGGVTGITANAGALTFTQAGTGTAVGSDRVQKFWCDVGAVTSLTLSFTVAAATDKLDLEINAIRGALAGAPVSSYYELRPVTNADPHDIDGNLNPPTSGVAIYSIGAGSGAIAFTGATALATQVNGKYYVRSASKVTTTGDVTIGGNASGGPSYTDLLIANSSWNHP